MGCVNPWDVWMDDPGDCYFQNVSLLLHYTIIFKYIIHINMYLIHISQYMSRYLFVLRSLRLLPVRVSLFSAPLLCGL